jgi:predicted enzyme related to lactoylglutathione lyase
MEESVGTTATITYLNFRPTLPVRDVERSCDFYQEIIGLEVLTLAPEYGLAILAKQGAMLALVQSSSDTPVVITPQVAYLYVTGVNALYAACQAKGVEIYTEITTQPYGMRDFVLKDPDGHIIGIGEQQQ